MLNKILEFLRIADTQPSDEKVRKRGESAQDLLAPLRDNRDILLGFLQVCDQCPDFDVSRDTAGGAEDAAHVHIEDYYGESGDNYGHTLTIAQVTQVGRYI